MRDKKGVIVKFLCRGGKTISNVIRFEIESSFATVTIDNPPMNVLSKQVTKELEETFKKIENDPTIIAVILTGAGNKAFMAGADIKEFPESLYLEDSEKMATSKRNNEVINYIADFSKPTIALLNGYTLGGGCELALACDLRIAEEGILIGLPEIKLGLFPGGGGTQRLPRLIGEARAKELMFLGEPISAEEALKIGLVNQVVPKGNGLETAQFIARKIGGYSLEALSRIKVAVNQGAEQSLKDGLELEAALFAEVFSTEDAKEGVQAFIEKRKPHFIHR